VVIRVAGYQALLSSKALPILIAAAFLVPGFVLGSQYGFYEDAPVWQVGDTWSYKVTITAVETSVGPVVTDEGAGVTQGTTDTDSEEGIFTMRVAKDDVDAKGIPAYALQFLANGRKADGLLVSKASINPLIPKFNMQSGTFTEESFEEFPLFQWPLTPGATWEYRAEDFAVFGFSVANRDFITVADSTYNAIRIEMRVTEILNPELRRMFESGDLQADFAFDYWYAPEVKNIARAEVRVDATMRDMGSFSFNAVMELLRGTGVEAPAGEGAEAIAPEALAVIEQVRIQLPEPLNFAEGKAATFTAVLDGPVPENLAYKWNIDGNTYTGETVKATFAESGLKTVSLQVMQGSNYLAEAEALYEVYYEEEFTGMHELLNGEDESFPVPVSFGGVISWTYQVDNQLPSSRPGDDVTLIAPDGSEVERSDEAEVMAPMPGEYLLNVNEGTFEYVSSPYRLRVSVHYPNGFYMPDLNMDVDPWMPAKKASTPKGPLVPLLEGALGKLCRLRC